MVGSIYHPYLANFTNKSSGYGATYKTLTPIGGGTPTPASFATITNPDREMASRLVDMFEVYTNPRFLLLPKFNAQDLVMGRLPYNCNSDTDGITYQPNGVQRAIVANEVAFTEEGYIRFDKPTTNLYPRGCDLTNAAVVKNNVSITANSGYSLNGTNDAFSVISTSDPSGSYMVNSFYANCSVSPNTKTYTFSCECRRTTSHNKGFKFRMTATSNTNENLDSAEQLPTTEWQRFSFTGTFGAGSDTNIQGLITINGGTSDGYEFKNLQIEEASIATLPIPTTGSQLARTQTSYACKYKNDIVKSDVISYFCEFEKRLLGNLIIFQNSNAGAAGYLVRLSQNGTNTVAAYVVDTTNGATAVSNATMTIPVGSIVRAAVSIDSVKGEIYLAAKVSTDGGATWSSMYTASNTSVPFVRTENTRSDLSLMSTTSVTGHTIRKLALWDRAFDSATLQDIVNGKYDFAMERFGLQCMMQNQKDIVELGYSEVATSQNTSSTSYVDLSTVHSVTVTLKERKVVEIDYEEKIIIASDATGASDEGYVQIYKDGVATGSIGQNFDNDVSSGNSPQTLKVKHREVLDPGTYVFSARHAGNGKTVTKSARKLFAYGYKQIA